MTYISFDPYKQTENGRFNCLSATELSDTIKRLYTGWQNWCLTSADKRIDLLRSLADLLLMQKSRHAGYITSEMGKPVSQAVSEIEKCATLCYYYGEHLKEFIAPGKRSSSARESYVFYEPQGIILGIMPWNFPYWQAMRFIIPVISGGNAVLLKHASNVPVCAGSIELVIREAGFPVDVFSNIFVSYDQIESVIEHPEVKGVSVTGSKKAGKKIAEIAGKNLKKIVLELGGSDPFIVLKDADLNAAAEAAVFSRFQNCGQSCIAAKRIFVQKEVFEGFLSLMGEKVRALKCGDPYDPETFIGPMVSDQALDELHEQIARSLSMGARAITGATRNTPDRPIYNPTLLVDVPEDSPLVCEEVFGPAIPVLKFTDIENVIKRANSSSFGLGASIWTSNTTTA